VRHIIRPTKLSLAAFGQHGVVTRPEFVTILATIESASEVGSVFVEVGTHFAGTSRVILTALNMLGKESTFYGLDIEKSQSNRKRKPFTAREKWDEVCGELAKSGPCRGEFVERSSWEWGREVEKQFAWVFVDGCHCFDCVKQDIRAFCPKVVPGGFVMFHDCHKIYLDYDEIQSYHAEPRLFGVWEAVSTAKELRGFELICQTSPNRLPGGRRLGGMSVYQRMPA
jgi:hypothetical protein